MASGDIRPLVSVIVPNYNHAAYLEDRINSILSQTYSPIELILLDDCSSDTSIDILQRYKIMTGASVLLNERNSGSTFLQWQKGLAQAKGEYIWIAESDDVSNPLFLETCMNAMLGNALLGIVFARSVVIDENGKHKRVYQPTSKRFNGKFDTDYEKTGLEEIKISFSFSNVIPNVSSALFRKEYIPQDLSMLSRYKLCGDWLFYIKILEQSSIRYISQPLNYFREHQRSVRSNTKRNRLTIEEQIEILLYLRKNSLILADEYKAAIRALVVRWYFFARNLSLKDNLRLFLRGTSLGFYFMYWAIIDTIYLFKFLISPRV